MFWMLSISAFHYPGIPCQCAHWRGIEEQPSSWTVFTEWKQQKSVVYNEFSDVERFNRTPLKHCYSNVRARRRGFSRGAVRRAANLMNRLPVAIAPLIHRLCGGSKQRSAPPLSRILSPFLGGTRKGPPEGSGLRHPSARKIREWLFF